MEDVHVRRDVWTLEPGDEGEPWDERLLAYARAVRAMQDRDPEDPLSWMGQASAYVARPRGTWFLLPWLRMHVWYFERIVRAAVVDAGGPEDWALPFWGYAGAPPARSAIPPAFVAAALPDGTPNPLRRSGRPAFLRAGEPLPAAVTSADRALAARAFSPGLGGPPGAPAHGVDARPPGLLEAQPLDSVTAVLGPDAALDPLFALHLAAVDRLWEVWLAQGDGRANPAHFDWADQWFSFCDADGRHRSLTCGQAGDLANLDYTYADVPARASATHVLGGDADAGPVSGSGVERRIATAPLGDVELGAEPRRIPLRAAGAGRTAAAGAAAPATAPVEGRVYLHLEGARAACGTAGSVWEVRVAGARSRCAGAVGTIALTGGAHDAHHFVFDITDAVEDLDPWDDRALEVSFHPALPAALAGCEAVSARVGSVFLTHG